MVNTADIRKNLEAVETAERHLDMIKSFAAKGGAYKLQIAVDSKNEWVGGEIAAIINQHLAKLPILGSVEKLLKQEIEAAKKALVEQTYGELKISADMSLDREIEKALYQAGKITMAPEAPDYLRRAK